MHGSLLRLHRSTITIEKPTIAISCTHFPVRDDVLRTAHIGRNFRISRFNQIFVLTLLLVLLTGFASAQFQNPIKAAKDAYNKAKQQQQQQQPAPQQQATASSISASSRQPGKPPRHRLRTTAA